MNELPRAVKIRPLPAQMRVEANEGERAALARRFGIGAVLSLEAEIELEQRARSIAATGTLEARIVQDCAVSGEPFESRLREDIDLRFVEELDLPEAQKDEDGEDVIEIDLDLSDADEIEYSGDTFDLGEAVAQTLGLAIDPYAEGPDADAVRAKVGLDEPQRENPFAALAGLRNGGA